MAKSVEILIYDGMNELEFAAIYEILTACEVTPQGARTPQAAFMVETVAERISPIETSHHLKLSAQKVASMSMGANILIVPGGPGARRPNIPVTITSWLTKAVGSAELICSCSTGVYILGRAGLINNRRVATHFAMVDDLHRQFPRANIVTGQRVSQDGRNLMTCAGGTAAIDLAISIIQRFYGQQAALTAMNRLEYTHFTPPV